MVDRKLPSDFEEKVKRSLRLAGWSPSRTIDTAPDRLELSKYGIQASEEWTRFYAEFGHLKFNVDGYPLHTYALDYLDDEFARDLRLLEKGSGKALTPIAHDTAFVQFYIGADGEFYSHIGGGETAGRLFHYGKDPIRFFGQLMFGTDVPSTDY